MPDMSRPMHIGAPHKTCRFPLWGQERPTHEYCGEPVQEKSSYCPEHHERCWNNPADVLKPRVIPAWRAA